MSENANAIFELSVDESVKHENVQDSWDEVNRMNDYVEDAIRRYIEEINDTIMGYQLSRLDMSEFTYIPKKVCVLGKWWILTDIHFTSPTAFADKIHLATYTRQD